MALAVERFYNANVALHCNNAQGQHGRVERNANDRVSSKDLAENVPRRGAQSKVMQSEVIDARAE